MKNGVMTLASLPVGVEIPARLVAIALLSVTLAAGCATSTTQDHAPKQEPAREEPRVESGRKEQNLATPAPTAAEVATLIFRFEKMSVALSDTEKAKVQALAERAKAAGSIVIRGYCDRKEVGNAKDAAIARANAVRTVLVKSGVSPAAVRIRYNTERSAHAAEIEFL